MAPSRRERVESLRPQPRPRPDAGPRPRLEPRPRPDAAPRARTEARRRPDPEPRRRPDDPPQAPPPPPPDDPRLDDVFVVRGGEPKPENLQKSVKEHRDVPGLTGFSVQSAPGLTVDQLAAAGAFPNPQIGWTTVRELLRLGVPVVPSPGQGYHNTAVTPMPLSVEQAREISRVFRQQPNPAQVRR